MLPALHTTNREGRSCWVTEYYMAHFVETERRPEWIEERRGKVEWDEPREY